MRILAAILAVLLAGCWGPTGLMEEEVVQWPEGVRGTDASSTVIITRTDTVVCSSHADKMPVIVPMQDAPVSPLETLGHPAEGDCAKWGRCPTCNRLILFYDHEPMKAWVPVSQKDTYTGVARIGDTWLEEASPNGVHAADVALSGGWLGAGQTCRPVVVIEPIPIPQGMEIIRAILELHLIVDPDSDFSCDAYPVIVDVDPARATWNTRDGVNAWGSPGCGAPGVDYDDTKVLRSGPVMDGTGWYTFIDSDNFTDEANRRKRTRWGIVLMVEPSDPAVIQFDSSEADERMRPIMRVWFQRATVQAASTTE